MSDPQNSPFRRTIVSLVPAITGWSTFRGAFGNLLLLAGAALSGTWVVHQTEYAIEYGSRFSAVMATTPHRLYMAPAGAVFLLLAISVAAVLCVVLRLLRAELASLRRGVPARLLPEHRHVDTTRWWPRVVRTATILALMQAALYTLQENLEYAAVGLPWPGLSVLFGERHLTVLPLHALAALILAILLWTAAGLLNTTRRTVAFVRRLARLFTRDTVSAALQPPERVSAPRILAPRGGRGLRSPPLAAR
ncbi:MAG: hypothetical protein ACRDFX_01105 [Chloroflexota bacterium]